MSASHGPARTIDLFKAAARKFSLDKASRLGAALAYFTAFALAPMIVVAVNVAGLILGEQAAQGEIVDRLSDTLGPETASFVEDMVRAADSSGALAGTIVGLAIALFAASALVVQLEGALNVVWDVPPREARGLRYQLRARTLGLIVVVSVGLMLIAVMVVHTTVASLSASLAEDSEVGRALVEGFDPLFGIVFGGVAFSLLFRFLPSAPVRWREALVGGTLASVLFTVGSWILSRYLATGRVGSGFGAASALIVLLVFVYYSVQMVLFGAEFARVYGLSRSAPASDSDDTVPAAIEAGAPAPAAATAAERPRSTRAAPLGTATAFLVGLVIGLRSPRD